MIIPSCSHNYCSLCIRKFLSYKTQCPICCTTVTEFDLKNNRILDDLVANFCSAREHLSQLALDSPPTSPQTPHHTTSVGRSYLAGSRGCLASKQEKKFMDCFLIKQNLLMSVKASEGSPTKVKGETTVVTVCQREGQSNSSETAGLADCGMLTSSPSDLPTENLALPSTSSGAKDVVKVDCPVCRVSIAEQYINKHLDSCLTREEKKESLRSSLSKRKPMAKVVYNLLSDRELKKKLKEIGLPIQGTKQQLVKRHQDFLHMYNAQCDSLTPKSAAEIAKQIEKSEKIRAQLENKSNESLMTFTKEQTEEEIDAVHTEYRMTHRSEFQQLINQLKSIRERKAREDKQEEETTVDPSHSTDDAKKQCNELNSFEGHVPQGEPEIPVVTARLVDLVGSPEYSNLSRSAVPTSPASSVSSSSDIFKNEEDDEMITESTDEGQNDVLIHCRSEKR
nr:PREDICTED: E3 ubiquitin-protein ligase RAD18 [Latimeria chalumnae]|eukprot:XP_014349428.1 PREDICTED: E3 ubiquitin-protein ligase RAD18 [Latimeria chalumnae]